MAVRHDHSGERGTALVVALLVMVMMTLLGIPFLLMGETENRIADNERISLQAHYAAEAGAQMVKRWFDQPMSTRNAANPTLAAVDRSLRWIDADGDPSTSPVVADGSPARPFYKQYDDAIFQSPYRGSLADTLLGTAAGPDIRIDAAGSSDAEAFLDGLSYTLLGGYPASGRQARITLIDVYAPPTILKSGSWVRYGVASVRVRAGIYETSSDGAERLLAERTVTFVLNEIPYEQDTRELGPLHSCGDVVWPGAFSVHWGTAAISGNAFLSSDLQAHHTVSLPRVPSPAANVDLLWGFDNPGEFDSYRSAIDGIWVDDPWLRVLVGGTIDFAPAGNQPWPFGWIPGDPLGDGDYPHQPAGSDDGNHSNYFQNVSNLTCPVLSYDKWKKTALGGGHNVHYYAWSNSDHAFHEDGTGPARTFREATDGKTGLFFFDTADGQPPRDDNGDGAFDNLTPAIELLGGNWSTQGMLYLNAEVFRVDGAHGQPVPLEPPAEPFRDEDADGRWDAGAEDWVNLTYPTALIGYRAHYGVDANDDYGGAPGSPVRNARGKTITADANLWGVLYTNGSVDSTGVVTYYGSVIARHGFDNYSASTNAPDILWDQTLSEHWPPGSWDMPRVVVTRWGTDE